MTIEFSCECGEIFQVEDEFAGRKGRCPTCKRIMVVPEPVKEQEPLELQEELEEGPQIFDQPHKEVVDETDSRDLPPGKRVEEEVEVFRGWEATPVEEEVYRTPAKDGGPLRPWTNIPRPVLIGIPAVILIGLMVFWLARPTDRKGSHPAKDRAPKATYSETQPKPSDVKPEPLKPEPSIGAISTQTPSTPQTTSAEKMDSKQPSAQQPTTSREPVASPSLAQEPKATKEEVKPPTPPQKPSAATGAKDPASVPKDTKDKGATRPKETKSPPVPSPTSRPPVASQGDYTVNVGAFKSQSMADALAEVLRKKGLDPFVWSMDLKKGPGKMYRVSVGRFPTRRQADQYAKELKEKHGLDTYVVKR